MTSEFLPCYDLDKIRVVTEVTGTLVNETRLRIGSGRGSATFRDASDNPILTRRGRPYIPGSSLKGSLRSWLESNIEVIFKEENYRYLVDLGAKDPKSCVKKENNEMHYCIPCIIFGHKDLSGRMNIMDAEVEGNFELESYTGVSINRFFGGQQSGNLYNLDYVSPGANFRFKTIIFNVNLEKEDEEWRERVREGVLFLIRSMTQGIFVGGRKSTGAGLVKLTNPKVRAFIQGSWKEVKISW